MSCRAARRNELAATPPDGATQAEHNTYDLEGLLLRMVRKGDSAALREWFATAPAIRGGVVANDLGLRFNVSASTILQKGEKVKVTVLDVVPDCLKIKAVMEGEWRVDDAPDYSKDL